MVIRRDGGAGAPSKAAPPKIAKPQSSWASVTSAANAKGRENKIARGAAQISGGGQPVAPGSRNAQPQTGGGSPIQSFSSIPQIQSSSAPMTPPAPSVEDYQASDSILTAALGALDRALKDYGAQWDSDVSNYERDYGQGLSDLGWQDRDAQTAGDQMGWNWDDILTSSGRAYQNQMGDFANRGMLQSQGYADALQSLERSLNDQRTAMGTARTDYLGDMNRQKTENQNQDTLARQQARAESTARRAAQYGIV